MEVSDYFNSRFTCGDILRAEEKIDTPYEVIGEILEDYLTKCFPIYKRPIRNLCEKIWYDEKTEENYCHRLINVEEFFRKKGIKKDY